MVAHSWRLTQWENASFYWCENHLTFGFWSRFDVLAAYLKFNVAKLLIFERKVFFEFYSTVKISNESEIVRYFEDSAFLSIFRCTYCSHIIEISCKRAKFCMAFCSTDIRCPFLRWTILIWPSLPVSVHTQDMSVFISVDRFFCLFSAVKFLTFWDQYSTA